MFFPPGIRKSRKSVNFGDKNVEIDYIDINKILAFKEETLKNYVSNLNELKELNEFKLLRKKEAKNATKRKLNMLNNEINYILDNFKFKLKHETHKNRLVALEEINKIERLK